MRLDAQRPARKRDVIASPLGDEGLAYDFSTHGTHCMAPPAYAMFQRCDGQTSIAELTAQLVPATLPDREALLSALDALVAAGLLEPLARAQPRRKIDR